MFIDQIKIKVKKVHSGKVVGIASVEWDDAEKNGWRLIGFKILKGNYDEGYQNSDGSPLFVAPPAYNDGIGKFHNIFYTAPPIWKLLQGKIIESFLDVQ